MTRTPITERDELSPGQMELRPESELRELNDPDAWERIAVPEGRPDKRSRTVENLLAEEDRTIAQLHIERARTDGDVARNYARGIIEDVDQKSSKLETARIKAREHFSGKRKEPTQLELDARIVQEHASLAAKIAHREYAPAGDEQRHPDYAPRQAIARKQAAGRARGEAITLLGRERAARRIVASGILQD